MLYYGPMKVVILASEVVPFAKTGGLADVAGALPKFLGSLGSEVAVILPLYRETRKKGLSLGRVVEHLEMDWSGKREGFSVLGRDEGPVRFLLVEKDEFFDRDQLYGTPQGDYPDNGERFAFFSKAALETVKHLGFRPDVVHAHDWQAAIALALLRNVYADDPFFSYTRSLFTIHNLAYQGLFDRDILGRIGLPDSLFNIEGLEFYGRVNYLKGGILYATAVNTVSRRYSQEIQTPEFGHRLDGLLRKRRDRLSGILNGADYTDWNPATDRFIIRPYDPTYLDGKKQCRKDLLQAFSLPEVAEDTPVIGMVSRLAGQKGFDILSEALEGIFKLGAVLVILGTGEDVYQKSLSAARKKHPRSFGLRIAFDEALSHKIYAGSDMFLIPSRYEPCGLTQMYSLRYGTIPVVRATGGLDDTIQEFDSVQGTGNGFKFADHTASALLAALQKAISVQRLKNRWRPLIQRAMACDFSWDKSAREYLRLYQKLPNL
ncbi:MAG: glycogen synthase GlgA [Candidatus Aminicenantales bacterium]